jgi:hypothetical protein
MFMHIPGHGDCGTDERTESAADAVTRPRGSSVFAAMTIDRRTRADS